MTSAMICLDVGGTEIKTALVSKTGEILCPIQYFPANSAAPAEELLTNLASVIRQTACGIEENDILGIRLAFPGPFDYINGISLMQGLDKYDSIYGMNLREELLHRLHFFKIRGEDIKFINDVSAFALGEMHFGCAVHARKSIFLCIGTGCGSAFGVDKQLVDEAVPGVPPNGYVYPVPFLNGCIDDYISKRGLMALSREMLGEALEGKELACRAEKGDAAASECFYRFGERLKSAVKPFVDSFEPDCLCIGGQITKSAGLFLPPLAAFCEKKGVKLHVTADTSQKALQGLSVL